MISSKQPLSNLQQQILKLYSAELPDEKLKEVSNLIANYLLQQSRNEADSIWLNNKYGEQQLNNWLGKK